MNNPLLLKLLPILAVTAAAAQAPIGLVTLSCDYPTNELSTNLTFKLYSTTNASVQLPWPLLSNYVGTSTVFKAKVPVPGQYFFVMSASNMWGEMPPSTVATTPPLPRSDVNLKAIKGE